MGLRKRGGFGVKPRRGCRESERRSQALRTDGDAAKRAAGIPEAFSYACLRVGRASVEKRFRDKSAPALRENLERSQEWGGLTELKVIRFRREFFRINPVKARSGSYKTLGF